MTAVDDTIFALSSGSPPAAIGVIRISGPRAGAALERLAGALPPPRQASLRILRGEGGDVLDRALVLFFPGPASATGEDCAELHCHGGRAVMAAVCGRLATIPGLRAAEAGEFTRRAFANGCIDLAEAEALADLLSAETEWQRRAAQTTLGGAVSRQVDEWRETLLALAAEVELSLDFSDEEDSVGIEEAFWARLDRLCNAIAVWLARPRAERLRDGVRVVLAGPPNSGKSSLFNALLQDGAAIVSAIAGTTRDVIERPVAFEGVPFVLVDTAGLHESTQDPVEAIGIDRAKEQLSRADIVLWLGPEGLGPDGALEIQSRCDEAGVAAATKSAPDYLVSSLTGEGLTELEKGLVARAKTLLPVPGEAVLNARQRALVSEAHAALVQIRQESDLLLIAENLRAARLAFDRFLGRASTEDMLDRLFGRFCIGK